jgi:hypothetical protein
LLCGAAASSRDFDGANDEVDWGNVMNVTTNDASWCIWVEMDSDTAADNFLGKKDSTSATVAGYRAFGGSDETAQCEVSDAVTEQNPGGSNIAGVWTHLCCVWDSTNDDLFVYQNAVQTASDTTGTLGSLSNTVNLQNGENADDSQDANARLAFGEIYLSKILTGSELLETFHKVGSLAADFRAPLMGDNAEREWQGKLTGTVSGTDASSASGPPTMMGPWGYAP